MNPAFSTTLQVHRSLSSSIFLLKPPAGPPLFLFQPSYPTMFGISFDISSSSWHGGSRSASSSCSGVSPDAYGVADAAAAFARGCLCPDSLKERVETYLVPLCSPSSPPQSGVQTLPGSALESKRARGSSIYIYTYTYVCTYICMCICMCMYIYI